MAVYRKDELAKILRDKRGNRTQAEFAEWLGVSRQALIQFEKGTYPPGDAVLDKLDLEKTYSDKK